MDRIVLDSGGIAETMMESLLADFMQKVGYGFGQVLKSVAI
jgi:CCR4-NOT transcription complex subunit 1